jgi:hypothetical protein
MKLVDINPDLTPETADSFLLVWTNDVSVDLLVNNLDKNLFLGHPKKLDENLVGVYANKKLLEIDWTLNPDNARDRGYEWTEDAIYDPEAPDVAMKIFFEMKEEGALYGEPANANLIENGFVGVYMPIGKE